MSWLWHLLGFDYGLPYGHLGLYNAWSGFGSDIGEVALIGGIIEFGRRAKRRHNEKLAQDARHHRERLEQADRHHEGLVRQAREHHNRMAEQAAEHHEALVRQLTPAAANTLPASAERLAPERRARATREHA